MTMTILIDSREKIPYRFPGLPVTVAGLKVGDYSLVDQEHSIAIERKTIDDLVASLSSGRSRFEAELERGRELDYFCLVIESSIEAILRGEYRSKMTPAAVLGSLLAFSVRYRLPIFFTGNRQYGETVVCGLLDNFRKQRGGPSAHA